MVSVDHFLVDGLTTKPFSEADDKLQNHEIPVSCQILRKSILFISWSVGSHPSTPPSIRSQMCLWPSGGGRPSLPGHRAPCWPPPGPAVPSVTALPAVRRPGRLSEPWWWRRPLSGPPCESDETLPASQRHGGCWWDYIITVTAFCRHTLRR